MIKSNILNFVVKLKTHIKSFWFIYILVALLAITFAKNFRLGFNLSPSLPGTVYLISLGTEPEPDMPFAFSWNDPKNQTPYRDGVTFIKLAAGVPGDFVMQKDGRIELKNWSLEPKTTSRKGKRLEATEFLGVIPEGHFFAAGVHKDSLDSRYKMVGLITQDRVIGKAYELF